MRLIESKKIFLVFSALAASAVMLTVIQPPISWSVLAWVVLVPFILICNPDVKPSLIFIAAYIISFFYWLGNLYWLAPVTAAGWIALCLYMALLWPLMAIALRFCRTKKLPLFLAVPVLVVGAERLQGFFAGGFFWRYLAYSQYANISLIQIADIFGAAGVSFLIAMVNGLLAELVIVIFDTRFNSMRPPAAGNPPINWGAKYIKNTFSILIVAVALAGAIIYGRWRINQSDKFIETGPLIAAVQSNVPQSVKQSHTASETIFDEMLQNSTEAAKAGASLIVWPETMVQAMLDERILKLLDASHLYKVFDESIKKHSKDTAFVLVGAHGGAPEVHQDFTIGFAQKYNSAFLYKPDGKKSDRQYNKIHLVPFGEVVPFEKSVPSLYKLLMKLTPYDYDYTLDYGSEYTVFEVTDLHRQQSRLYRFGVMICYEDTVPVIARKFTLDKQGRKNVDWLVNISNDGWFVRFTDDKVSPGTELSQHTAVCVFRAVENRVAVLRSVNTGISCLIDTLGRIKDGFAAGSLPQKTMARQGMPGWFADKVTIDKRITFFSKYGQWPDFCCTVGFVWLIIVSALGCFFRKKSDVPFVCQGRQNEEHSQKA